MIIGSDCGENYNFPNGQQINHKTRKEGKKLNTKGDISRKSCIHPLKLEM